MFKHLKWRKVIPRCFFEKPTVTSWLKCLIVYFLFFLLTISMAWLFINQLKLFPTNLDNARYIVSILIQSQAAIISIVVTLTLIAIQLTASIYSPRVVNVLRKNPDLWLLTLIYVTLMCFELIYLKALDGTPVSFTVDGYTYLEYMVNQDPVLFGRSQENILALLLGLGIFSIVILGPYTWNTMNILRSETIISKFVNELNTKNICNKEGESLQPFFDVINSAFLRYDVTTSRTGLKQIVSRVILLNDSLGDDERKQVSQDLCRYLFRSYIITDRLNDEEMGLEVIKSLKEFGIASLAWQNNSSTEFILFDSLEPIGKIIVSKKLSNSMFGLTDALTEIGKVASEHKQEVLATDACSVLGTLALDSAENGFFDYFQNLPDTIEPVCKVALANSFTGPVHSARDSLLSCAKRAIENDIGDHDVGMIIGSLGNIGRKTAEYNASLLFPLNGIIDSLAQLGNAAASKHLTKSVERSAATLCVIGAELFENGLKDDARKVITHLIELTEVDPRNAFTGVYKVQSEWDYGKRESFQEYIHPYWTECKNNPSMSRM